MNININTKYNIGDTVYVAWCYNGEFVPEIQPYVINTVYTYTKNENIKISYGIVDNNDGLEMEIPEDACFRSYAKCTKWCEEHNKNS